MYVFPQIMSCKINKKTSSGFDVLMEQDNFVAFLPRSHLTDHMTLTDLLYDMYRKGDILPDVMVFQKTNVLVSCLLYVVKISWYC